MRPLPQTRLGTFLVAFAAWLAGCAAVWWVLPVRPRMVLISDAEQTNGFTADGLHFYVQDSFLLDQPSSSSAALHYWDVQTGRCRLNWKPAGRVYALRPKQGVALVAATEPESSQVALLDLWTGRRDEVSWPAPESLPDAFTTANGRYLVFALYRDHRNLTVWWDREAHRTVGTFPGVRPLAFASDGRWITRGEESSDFVLRAPASNVELVRLRRTVESERVSFSAGGAYIVICGDETDIVESATGRVCARLPAYRDLVVLDDVHQVVAIDEANGIGLVRWDLVSGQPIGRQDLAFLPTSEMKDLFIPLPARGQFLLLFYDPWRPTVLDPVLSRLPYVERFMTDGEDFVLIDARTGAQLTRYQLKLRVQALMDVAPDERTFLFARPDGQVDFWDIHPRKPLSWFAVAALVWSLPIIWLARRRARRLRSGVARG